MRAVEQLACEVKWCNSERGLSHCNEVVQNENRIISADCFFALAFLKADRRIRPGFL
jgi:hypothetical protein